MAQNPESSQSHANRIPGEAWVAYLAQQVDLDSAAITAEDAPFIRSALLRAQALRVIAANPGDAYLQGVSDALGYRDLQEIARNSEDSEISVADIIPPEAA